MFAIYSHGGHLGHVTLTIYKYFHFHFLICLTLSLALIGRAVSRKKMFEYFGHIHLYSTGAGADNLLGPKYIHEHKSSIHLLIPSKFF